MMVFSVSWLFGIRMRRKVDKQTVEFSSIFISSIFGFFAILIAFQLSGSTNIYETQRKLTVDEILSISAVMDSTQMLNAVDRKDVLKLLVEYVERRKHFYDRPIQFLGLQERGRAQKDAGLRLLHHAYASEI